MNALVPQRVLFGQSDNLTPTPTPISQSTLPASEAAGLPDSQQILDQQIDLLMENMSTADKVGQLFVVTFEGDDVGLGSDIAELIYLYRIGGVVLSPRNGNIKNDRRESEVDAIVHVTNLVNQLQALSYGYQWNSDFMPGTPITVTVTPFEDVQDTEIQRALENFRIVGEETGLGELNPPKLPLFIGVEQAGDGKSDENLPETSLRRGFTELPSQLAVGATWNPELARGVGSIVGRELAAIGVNMLLGPYLDVLNQPKAGPVGSLGTHSFGGDPFWVSMLGRAYIEGVHNSSNGRIMTIARHFPGQGDSDRLPSQEIANIQSDRQDLERFHFPPFVAVTSDISGTTASPQRDPAITDGLMSSHMYFSGLQGDPTGELKPFSFSNQFKEELASYDRWRVDGLMMTNELGSPAIQKLSLDGEFEGGAVTEDALKAGHDLLFLSQFSFDGLWQSEKANMIDAIINLQKEYDNPEKPEIRTLVDNSVRRILRAKIRLYGADRVLAQLQARTQASNLGGELTVPVTNSVSLSNTALITNTEVVTNVIALTATLHISIPIESVLISENPFNVLSGEVRGNSAQIIRQIAEDSLTLLIPDPSFYIERLPEQPGKNDKIVIITDVRSLKECESCSLENLVDPNEIQNIVLQRYGDEARKEIPADNIKSFTFSDLEQLLGPDEVVAEGVQTGDSPPETNESPQTGPEVNQDDVTEAGQSNDTGDGSSSDESAGRADEVAAADSTIATQMEVVSLTEQDLQDAKWIIFAMLDVVDERTESNAVKRFLNERQDLLSDAGKNIIVLALNAPYFLDGTEASRLEAYYGINSKIRPFLVSAVRLLFKDPLLPTIPQGDAPVSVPGTRYSNLQERLLPDPDRSIPIQLIVDGELLAQRPDEQDLDNGPLEIRYDQTLRIRIHSLMDRNGNLVKDSTPINFQVEYDDGNSILSIDPAGTVGGVAERLVPLDALAQQGGLLTISAYSGLNGDEVIRASSDSIQLHVIATENEAIATATQEAETTPMLTAEPAPAPISEIEGDERTNNPHIDLFTFTISIATMLAMVSLLLILQDRVLPRTMLVHNTLWAVIVGLFVYCLYGFLLPIELGSQGYPWAPPVAVFISMLVPLLWLQLRQD